MNSSSSTITTTTHFHSSSSCIKILRKRYNNYETRHSALKFNAENENNKFLTLSLRSIKNYGFGPNSPSKLHARNPSLAAAAAIEFERPLETDGLVVEDKLQLLVMEFKSLKEPMDRVKRLLHYAANLPPYDESARVAENRVVGCATQVWLEVEMDDLGRMRFRADSDSEISKGFCSCLIWMLDGAKPEEVLEMRAEDLEYVNVGLYVKANSRVNTWHNVLISMQKRTKTLVMEKEGKNPPLLEPLPSLIVNHGSSAEAQIQATRWKELDANLSLF